MHRTFSHLIAAALFLVVFLVPGAQAQQRDFVEVRDGRFFIGDDPYYFLGFNYWYGMNLGADHESGDRDRLRRELDHLASIGVDNLRVLAGSEGPREGQWRVHPAVQDAPGEYNEQILIGLDHLLAEMGRRDMRAVLVLNNFFQWSGGMAQYVSWVTGDPIPYPEQDGNTWTDFQTFSARFYTLPEAQRLFLDYVDTVISRTNTVNGVRYSEDPTIMSWQLANEPRVFGVREPYAAWVRETTSFIKQRAPRQLVSLGGEGKLVYDQTEMQFEELATTSDLDYLTIHVWIENWQRFLPEEDPENTFLPAVGFAFAYISDHVAIAERVNMPVVLEEFGISRDGFDHDPSAPVSYRDQYFEMLFAFLRQKAEVGSAFSGLNIWTYSGEGRPVEPRTPWTPGDPFTGDPPHELQGWYGIYDTDTSTFDLIRRYAEMVRR
jgi:mannan endo-1,4-beta-mannosidase